MLVDLRTAVRDAVKDGSKYLKAEVLVISSKRLDGKELYEYKLAQFPTGGQNE